MNLSWKLFRCSEILAVNTILDEERNLIHVNFGEVLASHQEAVNFAEPVVRYPLVENLKQF